MKTIEEAIKGKLPSEPNCFKCGFFKDGECGLLEVKVEVVYRECYEPSEDCPGWELYQWLPF